MIKFCLPALLCLCLSTFAQTVNYDSVYPPYQDQLNHLFQHVDLTQVPNRNLKEFGIPLVEPLSFGAYLDSNNYADADVFGLMYATLFSMATDSNYRLPRPDNYMQHLDQQSEKSVELLGLFHTYYSIDSNSLENNLFTRLDDQLYDVDERDQSPYLKHTTFMMAPARQWIHSAELKLSYNSALFYNNTGLGVNRFYIDFDNGSGYQLINGFVIPAVTYASSGLKDVKFKIEASDGSIWVSHSKLFIDFDVEKSSVNFPYDQVDDSFLVTATESFDGVFAWANVHISYACGHTNLQKPFIWVEGYNPYSSSEKMNMELDYNDAVKRIQTVIELDNDLLLDNYLEREGYDFIMVDFGDSDTYLEANALMLEEVIRKINALKHSNGSNEKNVVMGQSMGGMCLRYALRDMEVKGQDHETSSYVSFDSGHMGVNLPLGAQYALKHIANISVGYGTGIHLQNFIHLLSEARRIADLKSSRTMLYYNANQTWDQTSWITDVNAASLHDNYYHQQNEVLGMPQKCDRIAIINGSLNGVNGKQNFEPGDELVRFQGNNFTLAPLLCIWFSDKYKASSLFFWSLVQSTAMGGLGVNVSADVRLYALQDNANEQLIYRGNIIGTALFTPVVFTNCTKRVSNKLGIDAAPGAYVGEHPMKGFNLPGLSIFRINSFCFTPVSSTLNDFTGSSTATRFAQLSNDYTDKYAYLNGNTSSGIQAYEGITQAVFEDTINSYFNNTGHTWFNTQNAPAMKRYLIGVDQINGINSFSGTTYNFGKLPLGPQTEYLNLGMVRTTSRITQSLTVQNGVLGVNFGNYIGFIQNSGSVVTDYHGYFRVDIVQSCNDPQPITVTAQDGSTVEVGDQIGRAGDLYIQQGNRLVIGANSKLNVYPNSRVIVESGATLELQSTAELAIYNEGSVIVKAGGKLLYAQNSQITTFDQNARLYMQGTLEVGQNATFKVARSGSNQSGIVIFSGKPKITAEPGVYFNFDAVGNYDPVVQVDANTYVAFDDPDIVQVKFTQCAVVMDAYANMTVAPTLLVDHSTFQGRDRQDAKLSFRSKNQFYLSTFTDIILQGDEYYPASDVVNISNCTFNTMRTSLQGTTTYHVAVYGKGYNIHDCSFTNLINEASVYSEDLTLTSGISNCTFTSTIGGTAAMEDRSNVEIDFYNNTLSNLREAVIKSSGILTMSCNTMSNMSYRYITATDGAKVNLSTQSGGGYNQFGICTDLNYWSHIWLTHSDIDMSSGANTFAKNNYHQYFVTGTLASNCATALTCNRNFSLNNFTYTPSAPASKFNLKSANNYTVNCTSANLYFDPACGSLSSDGPIDPDGGTTQSLQALPTYYSEIMDATVRLDYGVKYAKDETTEIAEINGDDVSAINRFDEIFTAPIPADGDNVRFMMNAQDVMKTTVENLVLDGLTDVGQNQAVFTPEFDKYVNSLNKMSDSIIDTTNYREQFYLEMKKVTLFRLLDNSSKALEIIQNIEACGVDSSEQAVLNREKMFAQRVVAAAQYDPETDSIFEFKPAGLIEPVANAKSQYYFGSRIVDPSYMTFMTCMEDSKSLTIKGSKEIDGVRMNLYPNPAMDKMNFQITDDAAQSGQIRIFQPDGRILLQSNISTSGQEQFVDVSSWASGVYQFVYYRPNGTTIQHRFVVE